MRLIDADALKQIMIETLEALLKNPKMDNQEAHLLAAFHIVGKMIDDAPTADAVDVVKCKDCVHRKNSNTLPPRCEVFDWFSKKNDYCSFAERRSE